MSKKTLEELAALLDFVKADLAGIEADYEDLFVEQLQNSVRRIKKAEKLGNVIWCLSSICRNMSRNMQTKFVKKQEQKAWSRASSRALRKALRGAGKKP